MAHILLAVRGKNVRVWGRVWVETGNTLVNDMLYPRNRVFLNMGIL